MAELVHGAYHAVCRCGAIEVGRAGDARFDVPDGWVRIGNNPVCPACQEAP